MAIIMNIRMTIILLLLAFSFHSQGQKMNIENILDDDTLAIKCVDFIKTKTLDYNKELNPAPYADIALLLDSLWKENTCYLIRHYTFSVQNTVIRDTSPTLSQIITNDRRSPFLRYKLDKFPNGQYMLTIVQGHSY